MQSSFVVEAPLGSGRLYQLATSPGYPSSGFCSMGRSSVVPNGTSKPERGFSPYATGTCNLSERSRPWDSSFI